MSLIGLILRVTHRVSSVREVPEEPNAENLRSSEIGDVTHLHRSGSSHVCLSWLWSSL